MKRFITLQKEVGETPLMAVKRLKAAYPEYADVTASYAGRLDPMAEGKLLVLLGDECKRQARYTGLDKEYEVEVLLDVGSDTGDALGLTTASGKETRANEPILRQILKSEEGTHTRPYPTFSSKTVAGKPLFLHALEGSTVEAPEHEEDIYRARLLGVERISSLALSERIEALLTLAPKSDEPSKALGADFRIDAVRATWECVFMEERSYVIVRIRVVCGSGTYMRSLAGRIGESLGTNALALSIRRTRIGRFWGGLWLRSF
jgi:tRNA pseudouridine55 synthase